MSTEHLRAVAQVGRVKRSDEPGPPECPQISTSFSSLHIAHTHLKATQEVTLKLGFS